MSGSGMVRCPRHPSVETGLRCARCETPICPDCLIPGAVGMLCGKCGRSQLPGVDVPWLRFAWVLVAGVACGAVIAMLLRSASFLQLILAPILGGFLGELVNRLTGRKRGPRVEALTVASLVGGALVAALLFGGIGYWLANPLSAVFQLVALTLAAAAAIARVRI